MDNNISVKKYNGTLHKDTWDQCISEAVNTHFLFYRDYMEYHSDRFKDHSLMIYRDDKLIGVLPASEKGDTVNSHGGLTFGGIIHPYKTTATQVIDSMRVVVKYYKEAGFQKFIYKPSPWTYHTQPCEADKYALHQLGAKLAETHLAVSIDYANPLKFSGGRKNQIQRAKKNGVTLHKSDDWETFIELLSNILMERHHATPVHTAEEMRLLQSRFPQNIELWTAQNEDEMLAGAVLYLTPVAVHTQYLASSDKGCHLGALDLLLSKLIQDYSDSKRYFCFGTCTEDGGTVLNEGLLFQKESFGGRSVIHEIWEIDLTKDYE